MCAPDPPKPPDYTGQAKAQGEANIASAINQAYLNNPNIINPYGSQITTWDQVNQTGGNRPSGFDPGLGGEGGAYYQPTNYSSTQTAPQATVTQTFSESQQRQFDDKNTIIDSLNKTAISGLDRVGTQMGTPFPGKDTFSSAGSIDTSTLPDVSNIDMSNAQNYTGIDLNALPQVNQLTNEGLNFGQLNMEQLQQLGGLSNEDLQKLTNLDLSKLYQHTIDPSVGGLQSVTDAIRARAAPGFAQQRSAMESDLIARGFSPGGSGYDERIATFDRGQNDFNLAALLAGGQEQTRLMNAEGARRGEGLFEQQAQLTADTGIRSTQFGERSSIADYEMEMRQQGLDEQTIQANLTDRQRAQEFMERGDMQSAGMILRAQGLNEQQVQAQINAAIRQGQLGEQGAIAGFEEGQRGARFNEQVTEARYADTTRAREIQEEEWFRNQPLRELNSLRTGNNPSLPNFQQYTGGGNIQAAPVFDAALAQGNFDISNFQNQGGGLFDLLGAGLGAAGAAGGFGPLFAGAGALFGGK